MAVSWSQLGPGTRPRQEPRTSAAGLIGGPGKWNGSGAWILTGCVFVIKAPEEEAELESGQKKGLCGQEGTQKTAAGAFRERPLLAKRGVLSSDCLGVGKLWCQKSPI